MTGQFADDVHDAEAVGASAALLAESGPEQVRGAGPESAVGATAVSGLAATAGPSPATDPAAEADLRVAHVLLRMGSPLPARAHLETLAGTNRLDRQGLLDLAESRWRTGDLPGAGEATVAYFETGGASALAYLIAAEATAATGRPGEAGRFSRRALDGLTLPLDTVFAGQPRSPIWPNDPADPGRQAGPLFAEPGNEAARGGRIGLTRPSRATVDAPPARGRSDSGGVGVMAGPAPGGNGNGSDVLREITPDRGLWDEPERTREHAAMVPAEAVPPGWSLAGKPREETGRGPAAEPLREHAHVDRDGLDPALPDVSAELEAARGDLEAGDARAAAVRLAVVLRLRPGLAPAVLEMTSDVPGPDFDLLRGDAFRIVGHEAAAQRAFAAAASALPDLPGARSTE